MIDVKVKLRGKIANEVLTNRIVQKQIQHEIIGALAERLTRKGPQGSGGKGLGVKRNIITKNEKFRELEIRSTAKVPRTTGRAWHAKNIAIVKSITPRVANKTARRIEEELSL